MMMYEVDEAPIEPDFLEELLGYKPIAQSMDMTLPRKYEYHYCPHCQGLNAFPVIVTTKEIVNVCDWCNGEFK